MHPHPHLISSPYIHRHLPSDCAEPPVMDISGEDEDEADGHRMALYSVVNKTKDPMAKSSDDNYEDTESEYAVELRKQAHWQALGGTIKGSASSFTLSSQCFL